MHQQLVGPARAEWDSRDLGPLLAGGRRTIYPAARVDEHQIWIRGINADAENVRVIDHTDRFVAGLLPAHPGVSCLPGKMPGADVDDVGVARIDSDRLDVANLFVADRRDALPGLAGID